MTHPEKCSCRELPTIAELRLRDAAGTWRAVSGRVYDALQRNGVLTLDELRLAAAGSSDLRKSESINMLLIRMQRRLDKHHIAIVRGVGKHSTTYRLVSTVIHSESR